MLKHLSPTEIKFLQDGISQNIRSDGRGRLDYRPFSLETGVITQTNGSARLTLSSTDVLVGIKAELGEPDANSPDKGRVQVSVECCPSASPEFEGRGAEELNIELARVIERVLVAPSALGLGSLCLIPGKQCWVLYIDVMVLDSGGNLFDAISIAVRAALATTTFVTSSTRVVSAVLNERGSWTLCRIPKVNVIEKPGGQYELELSDDADETVRINVDNVPICVTFTQIGGFEIIDASIEEELCLGCRTTLAVNKKGLFCTVQKGFGTVSVQSLKSMIKIGRRVAIQILEKLDDALAKEARERRQKIGFFL